MNGGLGSVEGRLVLAGEYRRALLEDVIPFWLRHGLDREHGGILTSIDRDGTVIDTDKSIWFQGRAGWMFATLFNTVEARPEWLEASRSCVEFLNRHGAGPGGKLYFQVTREGKPLRMRRYVYSEAFAAIACAALGRATGDEALREAAIGHYERFLHHSFEPGVMPPKHEATRPTKGLAPLMIAIVTAQELRVNLGEVRVSGLDCTGWIDRCVAEIEADFLKPSERALLEVVGVDGGVLDHHDGRTLNPGHAIECAWFLLHEAKVRGGDRRLQGLGVRILDWMWERGWDRESGGLLYFTDLRGLPVQEYWHDMKFWWPHCEAVIATLLAYQATGEERHASMHAAVHRWSFRHFPDPEHGEWYGYLHRDGRVSSRAKGTQWKGPFHLPRMLWYCARALEQWEERKWT